MHKNGIIHRDLKLGNLFITDKMEIKIGDFGLATSIQYEGERKHTICGTPNYIAPEILEGKTLGHSYEVDIWALGVILYTLLVGRPPYETEDVKETYKKILSNIYSFPDHIYVSESAKDLIKKILIIDPTKRLKLDEIRNHAFLNETKIPASLPNSTCTMPPNVQFNRLNLMETNNVKNIFELSVIEMNENIKNINTIQNFALKAVNKINNNKDDDNTKLREAINIKPSIAYEKQSKGINDRVNLINDSFNKEKHQMLAKKLNTLSIENINFINDIVDCSKDFGFMYTSSNNLIGIYFNDKSIIYKYFNIEEFNYESKNTKSKLYNSKKLKDVQSEIRNKFEILKNYEKFLSNNSNNNNNTNLKINSDKNVKFKI